MKKLTFKQWVFIILIALVIIAILGVALSIGFKVIGLVLAWFGKGFLAGIIFTLIMFLIINYYSHKNKKSKV